MGQMGKRFLSGILIFFLLGLSGCGNNGENTQQESDKKNRVALSDDNAKSVHRQPMDDSSATPSAEQAKQKTEAQREIERKRSAFSALESVFRVVDGYQAFSQRWPKSIEDFDAGDYLFDSDYMAASVGEGYIVYLALTGGSDYQVWSVAASVPTAFRLDKQKRQVIAVRKEQELTEIDAAYRIEAQKNGLVFLVPRS